LSEGVIVVPYDPLWVQMFLDEVLALKYILQDELLEVHHIGSTSIPGMAAKPIVDMLPVVRDIERIDSFNEIFIEAGYEPRGELGLEGRRYFNKGKPVRTHHIHTYQEGHPSIIRHLAFRDYMIAHPDEAKAYVKLKLELAQRYADDRRAYTDGKDGFIKDRERRALDWWYSH
jgi:GrpB-like predicted nucleotidyltransferase (UPF0157 family)